MKTSSLILSLLLAASCTYKQNRGRRPASTGAVWSPLVKLKDRSFTFRGDHTRPRPEDGWWVTPIHVNLLGDGKVLITGWSRSMENWCGDHKGRQNGTSFVLDPAMLEKAQGGVLEVQPINEVPKDKRDVGYCAGHAPFPDGRILYTGGARYDNLDIAGQEQEYGLNYARVFDPSTNAFSLVKQTSPAGPNPSARRRATDWSWYEQGMMWYPTNTRLPNGVQLIAGGFAQQNGPFEPEFPNKSLALFDTKALDRGENPWKVLLAHESAPDAMNIGPFDYPHTYLLQRPVTIGAASYDVATWGGQNGQLALVNSKTGKVLEPAHGKRPDASNASDKTSVLLPDGKIMVMGGGTNGRGEGQRIDVYDPYTDSWKTPLNTGITRIRPASTLLPDGTVLILSGEGMWEGGGPTVGDRKSPTLYNPETHTFANLPPWSNDPADRGYHNISLLLKDGRVLVGGGRTLFKANGVEEYRIGCERPDLRIFTPPYLTKGFPRPSLNIPEGVSLSLSKKLIGIPFDGSKLKAKGGVVLMAFGAHTHHFDQNQRYVSLDYVADGQMLKVKPPRSLQETPEGEYMLFIISEAGVPSMARTIKVVP